MNTNNPSANYFAQVASQWDDLRGGYFSETVREVALAKAYLHPSLVVADIGAGTGFLAAGLAPKVRQVHVIDASSEMIAAARKNLGQYTNVEFHIADGLSLPLPDASLDAVFANMYLHHCPDPLAAIREMARTLRPGGRLVLTDMDAHAHAWFQDEMADIWLGFERDQIRTWLDQVGLVNVIVEGADQTCEADRQNAAGERAAVSIFVAAGTRRQEVHASVQANYAAQATGTGCGCSDSSCCSPGVIDLDAIGSVAWNGGYSLIEKASIPSEAAEFSLGCGNPLAMAELRPGETVLDIGSGGGIDAFLAAQRVGPHGRVIGVDMTPAMLERARQTAIRHGYPQVEFRQGFAEQMPVEDGEVDVVISNCVINLTEDKGKVFREAYRVLKTGGRLEVNDMVFGGAVPPEARLSPQGWSECISGALPEGEYVNLVEQAGFTQVRVRRSTSAGQAYGVALYSVQVSAKK